MSLFKVLKTKNIGVYRTYKVGLEFLADLFKFRNIISKVND